jgi:hypothetical protein
MLRRTLEFLLNNENNINYVVSKCYKSKSVVIFQLYYLNNCK